MINELKSEDMIEPVYFNIEETLRRVPEELIRKLYKIRSCRRNLPKDIGKERPCLYYHIKQCDAPCQGYVS